MIMERGTWKVRNSKKVAGKRTWRGERRDTEGGVQCSDGHIYTRTHALLFCSFYLYFIFYFGKINFVKGLNNRKIL